MPSSTSPAPTTRRRSSTTQPRPATPTQNRRISQTSPKAHRRTTSRTSTTLSDSETLPLRTPQHPTFHDADLNSSQPFPSTGLSGGDGGLDSLEDELAGAWDDDDGDVSVLSAGSHAGTETPQIGSPISPRREKRSSVTSVILSPTMTSRRSTEENTRPSSGRRDPCNGTPGKPRRHTRTRSRYDGSEFGPDLLHERDQEEAMEEASLFTMEMRAAMQDIEVLARYPVTMNGSILATNGSIPPTNGTTTPNSIAHGRKVSTNPGLDPIQHLLTHLQSLPPQSHLETLTSRLITTHTSLSSHLTHETRTIQSLTHPLFSPLTPPPSTETIDDLLPLLDTTLALLPQPSHTSRSSLAYLERSTEEAGASLAQLSDSLHMSRILEGEAARRLRVCVEGAVGWRREFERAEEARAYLEEGAWGVRVRGRGAEAVCREVCEGFEAEVEMWRGRLFGDGGAGAGTAMNGALERVGIGA